MALVDKLILCDGDFLSWFLIFMDIIVEKSFSYALEFVAIRLGSI